MITSSTPDPDELQDEPVSKPSPGLSRLTQWLIVLSLAITFLPLYFASTVIKEDTTLLNAQLDDIASTLAAPQIQKAGEQSLEGTLVQMQQQVGTLAVIWPTLNANRFDWPASMSVIGSYDQTQVVVTGVTQVNKVITLNGQAADENAVMAYAQLLKDSQQFSRVVVEGITIMPSPMPLPSPTALTVPANNPANSSDSLLNKFATFTIILEANQLPSATDDKP